MLSVLPTPFDNNWFFEGSVKHKTIIICFFILGDLHRVLQLVGSIMIWSDSWGLNLIVRQGWAIFPYGHYYIFGVEASGKTGEFDFGFVTGAPFCKHVNFWRSWGHRNQLYHYDSCRSSTNTNTVHLLTAVVELLLSIFSELLQPVHTLFLQVALGVLV